MKKFFALFLCLVYFVVSNGLTINKHYCGGKLFSVKIGVLNSYKCACGSSTMKKNCCHNQTILIKNTSQQNITKICFVNFSSKSFFKTFFSKDLSSFKHKRITSYREYNFSDNIIHKERPVFILNRVLII